MSASDSGTPAILYAAKSTEDKRKSIPDQLRDCRAMAKREGWRVVAEHSDEAASAWSGDRGPGLIAAIDAAEREAPCMLVVQHSDRLARGDAKQARHLVEVITWAVRANVTVRSVQDDLFADERMSVLMGALMGMRNTEDSRRKSEAVKAGMRRRRERGGYNGRVRPFGYRRVDGRLVIDPTEAAIVREMFDRFNRGDTLRSIADDFNRRGVENPQGGAWHHQRVAERLDNPIYIGKLGSRTTGEVSDGEHEPIIDAATWDRAASLRRAMHEADGKSTGRKPNRHLLGRGFGRCGICGSALYPRRDSRTGRETYRCSGKDRKTADCDARPIPREALDSAIIDYFREHVWDQAATLREFEDARDRAKVGATARREGAEAALSKLREREARITRDYQDGDLSAKRYEAQAAQLEAEIADAEDAVAVARAEEDQANATAADALAEDFAAIREAVANAVNEPDTLAGVRAALQRVFSHFTVGPVRNPNPILRDDDTIIAKDKRAEFIALPEARPEAMAAIELSDPESYRPPRREPNQPEAWPDAEPAPHPQQVPLVLNGRHGSPCL